MKKHLLLAITLQLVIIGAHAQIPNASFENWTGGNPDNWLTANSPYTVFVTQVNNAHEGNSALRNDVLSILNYTFTSPLILGNTGQGVAISSAPEAIHGWYIFNSEGDDNFQAFALVLDNAGNLTGGGELDLAPTSVYTEFVINMVYYTGSPNGDSLIIGFAMNNDSAGVVHTGSYYILDDLSYGLPTGVEDVSSQTTGLEPIFPNPASAKAQIIYSIKSSGNTELNIYDATGRLIKSLVNQVQSQGRYKALADVTDLPSGTYICKLSGGEKTDVQKLMVQH